MLPTDRAIKILISNERNWTRKYISGQWHGMTVSFMTLTLDLSSSQCLGHSGKRHQSIRFRYRSMRETMERLGSGSNISASAMHLSIFIVQSQHNNPSYQFSAPTASKRHWRTETSALSSSRQHWSVLSKRVSSCMFYLRPLLRWTY
jgi:hypothetical protein